MPVTIPQVRTLQTHPPIAAHGTRVADAFRAVSARVCAAFIIAGGGGGGGEVQVAVYVHHLGVKGCCAGMGGGAEEERAGAAFALRY